MILFIDGPFGRDVLMDRIASDAEEREAYARRTAQVEVCLRDLYDPAFGTEQSASRSAR